MDGTFTIANTDTGLLSVNEEVFNPTLNNSPIFWPWTNNTGTTKPKPAFFPCNNPDNLIDEVTAKGVVSLLHTTVLPVLEIFGITTNAINSIVFARQGLKDRINLCLFSLALADAALLVLMFSSKFSGFLSLFDEDLGEYWSKRNLGTLLGPRMGALHTSNLMTMVISLERCICVLAPFTAKKFLKTRYMAVVIVAIVIYVLSIYSLVNIKYVTVRVTNPITNTSRWVSRLSDFYTTNRFVIDILYNHLLNLTVPCLTLVVVIVATSLTVTRLRNTLTWRQESVHQKTSLEDKRETAVTKMLTVICFIYIATITPSVAQNFVRTMVPEYLNAGKYCNIFRLIQSVVHMCEVTNSSFNFIVYFTMGSRFRRTLRELIGQQTQRNTPSAKPLASVSQDP